MKELSFWAAISALALAVSGCQTPSKAPSSPPDAPEYPAGRSIPPGTSETILERIPGPPELPEFYTRSLRLFSVPPPPPAPSRWIIFQWDPAPIPSPVYRLEWTRYSPFDSFDSFDSEETGAIETVQSKVDIAGHLRELSLPPGWYRFRVSVVNDVFIPSESVPLGVMLWKP